MINVKNGVFHLKTKSTSYIMAVEQGIMFHLYWGKRLNGDFTLDDFIFNKQKYAWGAVDLYLDGKEASTEHLPMEYPTFGSGDLRYPALHCVYEDGSSVTRLIYKEHKIINGKPSLEGLPATYVEAEDEAQTLVITLVDKVKGLTVELSYSVFEELDAVTRSVRITNDSKEVIRLQRAFSASVDFNFCDFKMLHLPGAWTRERYAETVPVMNARQVVESARGMSSPYHNPFYALLRGDASEKSGEVYGFNLVYTGNFIGSAERDSYGNCRASLGIHPQNFEFYLEGGDSFQTPEAVLVYSDRGLGKMSRIYHKLYRTRLVRGKFRDIERSVLINSWETTYFNFTEEKLIDIAKKAKEVGIEMFVMDDGWFGKRNTDNCSLGDWVVNKDKFPNGMDNLVRSINDLGMKFGLWFEPEMVSPNSDLYRTHPDWCLHVDGRDRLLCRNQLTLDLSRDEVCDYIIESLSNVLGSLNIEYVKWDMNRSFSEAGSPILGKHRQGEVAHRYILGLYRVFETLTNRFPHVLFESCSSGGGRFDAGMLHYTPQVWTSDNTDAYDRLFIQYGTSLCYPYNTMGAHVSVVPCHVNRRVTPFKFRGDVAVTGQLGYELNLGNCTEKELEVTAELVAKYKRIGRDLHTADLYRLEIPGDGDFVANQFITEDGSRVYLYVYCMQVTFNTSSKAIRLDGLCEDAEYVEVSTGKSYSGAYLMNVGLPFDRNNQYMSWDMCFEKK